jgi:protein-arginine kinase activator protein McsA
MLCQHCHEREATCHVVEMADGVLKSRDLCNECFESESPEAKERAAEALAARCQYCGGQPVSGGTDFLALSMGVEQTKFMCWPCSQEFHRYTGQELERFPDGLSQQEQLAALGDLREAADKHMKQWVSQRGAQ